jgi:hypothetical protein
VEFPVVVAEPLDYRNPKHVDEPIDQRSPPRRIKAQSIEYFVLAQGGRFPTS